MFFGEEMEPRLLMSGSASQLGKTSSAVLQKPKEEGEESTRKSSTRHPGSISIKYSDILLLADP